MRYIAKNEEIEEVASLRQPLKEVLEGLGFSLIELTVFRHRGSVQVRAVIYNGASVGVDDCTNAHRAIMPKLELAFPKQEISLEVSSPGTDRTIRDGVEFTHYTGKGVRCYRKDISDWTAGVLQSADEKGVVLKTKEGNVRLEFDIIAKAKLDGSLQS